VAPLEQSFVVVTWEDIENLSLKLFSLLKQSFLPDIIVGVARGGWIIARLLSDYLEIPNITSIKVEFYKGIREHSSEPLITQPLTVQVKDLKVLIVDDVADSGSSLLKAKQHVQHKGAKVVKTATLHLKPWSKIKPDYYAEVVSGWVIYPWEVKETMKNLLKNWRGEGLSRDQILSRLVNMGLRRHVVDKLLEEF